MTLSVCGNTTDVGENPPRIRQITESIYSFCLEIPNRTRLLVMQSQLAHQIKKSICCQAEV